ncbi:hypothetical protein DFP72DRAFT_1093570 [Ephemerocybe angulata]|uniref:Uncharacterized protein n=1 Tax=Ephemerocybe angulata TaxID=980116 RepID=A0A8H6HD04_9AGAR|nr:hypothetical protein DFP72DRAFT_1093570 [Tulosesus angulatus]
MLATTLNSLKAISAGPSTPAERAFMRSLSTFISRHVDALQNKPEGGSNEPSTELVSLEPTPVNGLRDARGTHINPLTKTGKLASAHTGSKWNSYYYSTTLDLREMSKETSKAEQDMVELVTQYLDDNGFRILTLTPAPGFVAKVEEQVGICPPGFVVQYWVEAVKNSEDGHPGSRVDHFYSLRKLKKPLSSAEFRTATYDQLFQTSLNDDQQESLSTNQEMDPDLEKAEPLFCIEDKYALGTKRDPSQWNTTRSHFTGGLALKNAPTQVRSCGAQLLKYGAVYSIGDVILSDAQLYIRWKFDPDSMASLKEARPLEIPQPAVPSRISGQCETTQLEGARDMVLRTLMDTLRRKFGEFTFDKDGTGIGKWTKGGECRGPVAFRQDFVNKRARNNRSGQVTMEVGGLSKARDGQKDD